MILNPCSIVFKIMFKKNGLKGGNVREGLVTRAKDEDRLTRSAKDRHGLARRKEDRLG